ncbi:MAG: tRNA preQ1(34) S-adenosylmethionine ribosyltransferase-isomerase QueA [Gammaproteobacteria bacterium RIFCSPHIGHO2_12_FULL_42_10]|nr:MAG: tRNA preQ1(34) S-adenosylmethionine ribosyltransferase-isomerase QueA [Gammaproteobacteria bacterium RIFCSPHIGHO2_12_FULL_42_10]
MQLSDFDFELPDALIARYPAKIRSESRLLAVTKDLQQVAHYIFKDMIELVRPGDLLIFNDTRVIPARLFGKKPTGGKIELLIERILDTHHVLAQIKGGKGCEIGDWLTIEIENQTTALVLLEKNPPFYKLRLEAFGLTIYDVVKLAGSIPLPPYLRREAESIDEERYQTVYAEHLGSVAAPTAGFHFDQALLHTLREKGVESAALTLHIGAGTFAPVRVANLDEHRMHAEYCFVPKILCDKIMNKRMQGGRVIAVGTTSLRALETACQGGEMQPYCGETTLFIRPGHIFHSADVLITNFHLPTSTLLMLVAAFGGYEKMMNAYRKAVVSAYRFYSYGDAMWIEKA